MSPFHHSAFIQLLLCVRLRWEEAPYQWREGRLRESNLVMTELANTVAAPELVLLVKQPRG